MSWIKKPFDQYWFRVNAGRGNNVATVFCVKNNRTAGWLIFERDRTETMARKVGTDTIQLFYPADMFHPVMSTLRMEDKLELHYHDGAKWGYVISGREEIGDM